MSKDGTSKRLRGEASRQMARMWSLGSPPWELHSDNDQKNLNEFSPSLLVGAQLVSSMISVHKTQSRAPAEPCWPAKLQACEKMGAVGGGK